MTGKGLPILRYIQVGAAVLASLNLIAVLVFQYDFSFLTRSAPSSAEEGDSSGSAVSESAGAYSFSVEAEPLTYDGTSKLDLLNGVAVLNAEGEEEEMKIFAEISGTKVANEKIIRYSAATPDGQITAERSLVLENYAGVSLSLPKKLPSLRAEELDSMLDALSEEEDFHAEDGYGNDITTQVTAKHKADKNDPTQIQYTFTVTNLFGDTAAVSMDLKTTALPIIKLFANETTVKVGEKFFPLTFVQEAVDVDGTTSLENNISVEGEKVDTEEPGTYHVEYVAYSQIDHSEGSASLTVIVEE